MNVLHALKKIQSAIKPGESPVLDAQVLLAHLMQKPRTWIMAHPEASLTNSQLEEITLALFRLENGEALPYILGKWEFYGLEFIITPDVLIPRPETELMVDQALQWLKAQPEPLAADIGTGSGCIAVTLASHLPGLSIVASDLSLRAVQIARQNSIKHGVSDRVWLLQADLLNAYGKSFDLICANLPYISRQNLLSLEVFKREPTLALDGGADGLEKIRQLLNQAPFLIKKGGMLLLEIEENNGPAALMLAKKAFPTGDVQLLPDLEKKDRLIRIINH